MSAAADPAGAGAEAFVTGWAWVVVAMRFSLGVQRTDAGMSSRAAASACARTSASPM